MKKTVIVNIYNFIRSGPSDMAEFMLDDFETIKNEIITVKQYGFPGTYALKHDALMDPRYQELLKTYLDESDELGAWWEITDELCERAGISFRNQNEVEVYEDQVQSTYCLGYSPENRKKLVDAYMADFYSVFGCYPKSIGSWVIDSVTVQYAAEKYGVEVAAMCRDQIATDGFTLWGGWPNGMYFPSKDNEFIPAQTKENQLSVPMVRLLTPDPIYNFECGVRDGLQGVYSAEPAWLTGRDKNWIRWIFHSLTEEDAIGVGYAQVGQENGFLWENIKPGLAPQLDEIKRLHGMGKLRVETMAQSARWFKNKYRMTPPVTFQANTDWWAEKNLSTVNYAGANYRMSLLGEQGTLRIRDWFVYDESYPSRYLHHAMTGTESLNDAPPVLFPQFWKEGERPFIRLVDDRGQEPVGSVRFDAPSEFVSAAHLTAEGREVAAVVMNPGSVEITGEFSLSFDSLPVFESINGKEIRMRYEGFSYGFTVTQGKIRKAGKDGVLIAPEAGKIRIAMGKEYREEDIFTPAYLDNPVAMDTFTIHTPVPKIEILPFAPDFTPGNYVFTCGETGTVALSSKDAGVIRYTLDGTEPDERSAVYTEPISLTEDTVITARLFCEDGRRSECAVGTYRFCLTDMVLESDTKLDWRPVFSGKGLTDLLGGLRGTTDYLDFAWRGGLEDIDITCILQQETAIASIGMGFITNHRSGVVYPESLTLYVDDEAPRTMTIRNARGPREIMTGDFFFEVHAKVKKFRIVAKRFARMPEWCTYHGTDKVFTMADKLMVVPEK